MSGQVTEATSKTECPKNHLVSLFGDPLRHRHQTWRNPRLGQNSTMIQIFTLIGARYLSWAKIHIFPYRGLTWGTTVPGYTFLESSRRANVTPHLTCNAATYRFRGQNLGFFGPLGYPKGETLCPGPLSTTVQNFTPIGVTVAEMSVTGQLERWKELQQIWYKAKRTLALRLSIVIKDCARGIVLFKLTADRHEASRGLSAELLVNVWVKIFVDKSWIRRSLVCRSAYFFFKMSLTWQRNIFYIGQIF